MMRILGRGGRLCDGVTRRELMQIGAVSSLGLSLPAQPQAEVTGVSGGSAKAVILVNLLGGPSHLDMFDMKPQAPVEIRGEFNPISTSLPGLHICEHLPMTARTMHHSTLIRAHTHTFTTPTAHTTC